jgi:hypothetical protein
MSVKYSAEDAKSLREHVPQNDDRDSGVSGVAPAPESRLYRPDVDTSGIDERKLMRRIDWHVVPYLGLLYLLNFLDRGAIGNARVIIVTSILAVGREFDLLIMIMMQLYNMEKELHITDKQYLIALTVFFFPYSLLEVSVFVISSLYLLLRSIVAVL